MLSSASTGTWRVAAYTDPKRPAVGEATFMVEDYVPDRLEFDLSSHAKNYFAQRRLRRSASTDIFFTARPPQILSFPEK